MAPYFVQRRGDEGCRYGHDQSSQGLERERHIRGIGAPENWNLTIMTPREALAPAMALNAKNHETGTFV
jgi:hypothetical protein